MRTLESRVRNTTSLTYFPANPGPTSFVIYFLEMKRKAATNYRKNLIKADKYT